MDTIQINVEKTKSTKSTKSNKIEYESIKWLTGC